jgi:hypothetical protein
VVSPFSLLLFGCPLSSCYKITGRALDPFPLKELDKQEYLASLFLELAAAQVEYPIAATQYLGIEYKRFYRLEKVNGAPGP